MKIGMEKEGLIFNKDYSPANFKENELPKNFTLDFANHQLEIVSDVYDSAEELHKEMNNIIENEFLNDKILWPLSESSKINYKVNIDGLNCEKERNYRKHLIDKYDLEMLLMSGIHINLNDPLDTTKETQFDLLKKIYQYGPLLMQFVSFSPDHDYDDAMSIRNSQKFGYYNEHKLNLDYDNVDAFEASIEKAIDTKLIHSKKEIYSKVRLKNNNDKYYVEIRFIDLNPFYKIGISYETLKFFELAIECIMKYEIIEFDNQVNLDNFEQIALYGIDKRKEIKIANKIDSIYNHTNRLFEDIKKITNTVQQTRLITKMQLDFQNSNNDFYKIKNEMKFLTIDQLGKKYAFQRIEFEPLFKEYDLELSTKILMQKAYEKNMDFSVIDEKNNIIKIKNQYIVQATKTNADGYANIILMNNKYVTKKILNEAMINTPKGIKLQKNIDIDYSLFETKDIVVKPLDTNFGMGITIIHKGSSKEVIDNAISFAFEYSDTILVEEFIRGIEYRFLVIDGKCISIVKRIPANVIGDGIKSIEQLITKKNLSNLRGKNYKTPLELIELGEFELTYLSQQNLSKDYVPTKNEQIFLRENSNISTGGDSEEVFDKIPKFFHEVAEKSALALDVKITGIDMIIDDLYSNEYSIIEANFNPAIQMHAYPFRGYGKNPSYEILKLLFKNI